MLRPADIHYFLSHAFYTRYMQKVTHASSHDQVSIEQRGERYELEEYCEQDALIELRGDLIDANEHIQKALSNTSKSGLIAREDILAYAAKVNWRLGLNFHFTAYDDGANDVGNRIAYGYLRKAIEISPTITEGYKWCFLGMVSESGGRLENMQSFIEANIEQNPADAGMRYGIAYALYREAVETRAPLPGGETVGSNLDMIKNAKRHIEEGLEHNEGDPLLLSLLGRIQYIFDAKEELCQTVLKLREAEACNKKSAVGILYSNVRKTDSAALHVFLLKLEAPDKE